ncbi:MAG TPA: alanine racemase, partial [Elusimicrobiota bacterium]|nr:alanine racemase [Elusimicrobiota bacterium]
MSAAPRQLLKWIEVDLGALRSNARWVRSQLRPGVRLMAVVKADAYGHGAAQAAKTFLDSGAACLGVLTLDEALSLRSAGVRGTVVVLAPILPAQAREAVRAKVEVTAASGELLRALDRAGGRARVHVDLDYGLGRWGLPAKELPALLRAADRLSGVRVVGISAHLDYVPGKNAVEAEEKLRGFAAIAAREKAARPDLVCHAANSSIVLDFPHWQMDLARVGNLLYGINPTRRETPLRPPWRLTARIIALRDVPKGASIGYASEYIAPRRMRVATLPVGYADGLTMEPAERLIRLGHGVHYWGMLRGKKAPFVGRTGIAHVL